jgi:hypothetical protein
MMIPIELISYIFVYLNLAPNYMGLPLFHTKLLQWPVVLKCTLLNLFSSSERLILAVYSCICMDILSILFIWTQD